MMFDQVIADANTCKCDDFPKKYCECKCNNFLWMYASANYDKFVINVPTLVYANTIQNATSCLRTKPNGCYRKMTTVQSKLCHYSI